MARTTTPSFVRDPAAAARMASLLRDWADVEQEEADRRNADTDPPSRSERTRTEQAIEEVRGWADELDPPADVPAGERPTHIRPARDYPQAASDA
jgi:hypothetical protein